MIRMVPGVDLMSAKARAKDKKFLRWQGRVSEKTRHLSQLVEAQILPPLVELGFERVEVALRQSDWAVNPNEICIERLRGSVIDSIDIPFGKYGDPKFQVGFSRRELAPPNAFIRSGVLVKRANQRYCFWGKPSLLPSVLWPLEGNRKAVLYVVQCLPQVVQFLDSGERGSNISAE
jgi:hypothetical protein